MTMSCGVDARKEVFEKVTVLDKTMLFTCLRVDRATVPKGIYLYEVRHDDCGGGDPCQIGKRILVNHWGTLLSNEPLKQISVAHRENAFLDVDPERDWNYEGVESTLKEYMEKYPPKRDKTRNHER